MIFCQFPNFFVLFLTSKMKCQMIKTVHFRHLLLFAYVKGIINAKAVREVSEVYGGGSISQSAARHWISRFKTGNLELEDWAHSGRQVQLDERRLNQLLH